MKIFSGLVFILAFMAVVFFITTILQDKLHSKYESLIGRSVVVNKDTLQIVDYSVFANSVTLSNGIEVSMHYTEMNIIDTIK